MPNRKDFFVYEMTPVKDNKHVPSSRAANTESTSNDGFANTPTGSSRSTLRATAQTNTTTLAGTALSPETRARTYPNLSADTSPAPETSALTYASLSTYIGTSPETGAPNYASLSTFHGTTPEIGDPNYASRSPYTRPSQEISARTYTDPSTYTGVSAETDISTYAGISTYTGASVEPGHSIFTGISTLGSIYTNASSIDPYDGIPRYTGTSASTGPSRYTTTSRFTNTSADTSLSNYGNPSADGSSRIRYRSEGPVHSDKSSSMYNEKYGHHGRRSPTPSVFTLEREVRNYINKRESSAYQFYPGAERLEYDYIEERTDMHSTNLIESTAYLIKGSLGAGVLSMHEAYMNGGLWTSLAATILIGILISYLLLMLIRSAQKMYDRLRISKLSYPDLAEAAAATAPWHCVRKCSKAFRYTVDTCLFLEMCGNCCIYQIMIAHTLKQVLEGIHFPTTEWIVDIRLYILIGTPCLLLLVLIRSLKFLAPFAMLADIFIAMCVLTTLYYSLRTVQVGIMERPAWKSPHGFIRFCGLFMYCTCGICVALPVENNMRRPRSFRIAVQYAMSLVVLLTSMTGFFGYWGWGEACRSPITRHMPLNIFTTILQFLLVMMLSTTFAVQLWVPFRIVWHYIVIFQRYKRKSAGWERLYRLIMVTLVTGVSVIFPNLIPVMIFMGQFFMGFVAFVFPALIEFLVNWEADNINKVRWRSCKNFVLIIFGLLLSGSSFYSIRSGV